MLNLDMVGQDSLSELWGGIVLMCILGYIFQEEKGDGISEGENAGETTGGGRTENAW
jgi:hypothetical protein